MCCEVGEAVDIESKMGEVWLHFDVAAVREAADFDKFLALRCLEEGEFGAAWGLVAPHFFEAQCPLVEFNGLLKVVHTVAGMVQFVYDAHGEMV